MRHTLAFIASSVALAGCASGSDLVERPSIASTVQFDAVALIVASDLDMAATGYADAKLRQIPGERDRLTILTNLESEEPYANTVFASQSVVGWPGPMTLSRDNQLLYVVETQAEIDDYIEEVDDPYNASPGRSLTTIDISNLEQPRSLDVSDVCTDPGSVDIGGDGSWLAIGCRDNDESLVAVDLEDGIPSLVRDLGLKIPGSTQDNPGVNFARLSPDGRTMALNLRGQNLAFARIETNDAGKPVSASLIGDPLVIEDAWMSMGRWSEDGQYYISADTGWGPGDMDAVTNDAGTILSVAFDEGGEHTIVSRVATSLSPEGFDVSPDGSLLAVANMERTYLPEGLPFSLFGGRDRSSLSLVHFDKETGLLTVIDGPVGFPGILPEDVVFDDDGDMIAVVSFQEKSETPEAGWVEFFAIEGEGQNVKIIPTGKRVDLARGSHDLVVVRGQ
ncbi:MAG: hypothetical protein AAF251_13035 [Pseudomonadota bacterium]